MVRERPLREFLQLIDACQPFALSRWGIPEWHTLFGERNSFLPRDGRWYFADMVRDLSAVLQDRPGYHLSLEGAAAAEFGPRVQAYLDGCRLGDLSWWLDAGRADGVAGLRALLGAVTRGPLVVAGPPHYRRARRFLGYRAFVDVPPRNPYLCVEDVTRGVLAALEDVAGVALVSVSGPVVAPLVVDALWRAGVRHQVVDFGAAWDAFAGLP